MTKQILCSVCGQPLLDGEARYYFPTLAEGHSLSAFAGIAHVECLRRENERLSIGKQLSDMRESMARADFSERYARDGNVLLRGRLADEGKIEIYDCEDFCDFSLEKSTALMFERGEMNQVVTPLISLVANENRLTYTCVRPSFSLKLEAISTSRLRELLRSFFEM
ncbi:hypothetical protein [Ralstonia psammae]|nr:hypothetical protein [Ralstonia sp. LMG 19083]